MSPRNDDEFATRTATTPVEVPRQRGPEAAPAARREQVSWGAVWAGTLVALPTYLVLEFLFFAFGWLDLAVDGGQRRAGVGARRRRHHRPGTGRRDVAAGPAGGDVGAAAGPGRPDR